MKFNDPFGRMEKRHQTGYESLRDSMQHGGIDTAEAARDVIRKTKIRALKLVVLCLLAIVLVAWLLPDALLGTMCVAFLIGVWLVTWTINGERYIQRYIKEELQNESSN